MTSASPASSILAKAAASTRWAELPENVQSMALDLFADAIAVIAGGSVHPSMVALVSTVAPPAGPSTVIGDRRGAVTRDAVLLNAATTTVLQRQDGHARAKGHPAAQLVPVVLALAEREQRAGAEDMLSAFVAGYEVAARVGVALGGVPSHLHDIGNWVTVGCAAAAAHLLSRADAGAIAAAIDGAASLALAFDRYTTAEGATMHHLYPAMATTQALAVAEGAVAGLTAVPGTLERFYGPTFGTNHDPAGFSDGIDEGGWSRFEISNGYFKLHPSCAHLHGVNDAVDLLLAEEHISEEDVVSVDVATFGVAMEIDTSTPDNDLSARFSAQATVAAAIRHGRLDDDGLLDLEALAPLMERISVRHDPDLDAHLPEGRPGVVTMRLADGREATRRVVFPRGTAQVLATPDERRDKAIGLLARLYGADGATDVYDAVMALGSGEGLDRLTGALRR
jgi:2-methylcitrate dehydratase PrpD